MSRYVWPATLAFTLAGSSALVTAQRAPAMSGTGLPADVLHLACAPTIAEEEPAMPLRVTGGQDAATRRNYAPGDLLTLNAGAKNGITVGQEFFVRRIQRERYFKSPLRPLTVRTAGWIRVYAVEDEMSLATVTFACDAIEVGDYLESFKLPQAVVPNAEKPKPERDHYARVLTADDLRTSFGKGDFLTINRGSDEGVTVGAQFVVYRDKREAQNFLFELGEAVAVSVNPRTATLLITLSRDAFNAGDYVAQRK